MNNYEVLYKLVVSAENKVQAWQKASEECPKGMVVLEVNNKE